MAKIAINGFGRIGKRGFANIALIILAIIIAGAAGYFVLQQKINLPALNHTPTPMPLTSSPTPNPMPASAVLLNSLTPMTGPIGTIVTIHGSGFTDMGPTRTGQGNRVQFGTLSILGVSSSDGKTLKFFVPETLIECTRGNAGPCPGSVPTPPGSYKISVSNENGTSNQLVFIVTAY